MAVSRQCENVTREYLLPISEDLSVIHSKSGERHIVQSSSTHWDDSGQESDPQQGQTRNQTYVFRPILKQLSPDTHLKTFALPAT